MSRGLATAEDRLWITTGWSGYLEARNLFDTTCIASASIAESANAASALFEPGTGRAFFGGPRYRM